MSSENPLQRAAPSRVPASIVRRVSQRARKLILKHWERGPDGGFAAEPYDAGDGRKTIGWGHVIRLQDCIIPPIDEARAQALFDADVGDVEVYISALMPPAAPQRLFDAACCLTFNVGIDHVDHGQRTKAAIRAADPMAFARVCPEWRLSRGQPMAGLVRRRAEEAALALGRSDEAILRIRETLGGFSSAGVLGLSPTALLNLSAGQTIHATAPADPAPAPKA